MHFSYLLLGCPVLGIFSKALLVPTCYLYSRKLTSRYNVPLPTLGRIPTLYSCQTASFINLELNAEIPLTVLIYMFSQYVCHFPASELLLRDKWLLTMAPTHQPATN